MTHPVTPFLNAGGFTYTAEVRPVPALGDDALHLSIRTRWAGARQPQAEQVAFSLTLSRTELEQLVADLQQALSSHPTKEQAQ